MATEENVFFGKRKTKKTGGNFAKGKKALAVSERSGFVFPWSEMIFEEGTGAFIHRSESDGKYHANYTAIAKISNGDGQGLSYTSKEPITVTTYTLSPNALMSLLNQATNQLENARLNPLLKDIGDLPTEADRYIYFSGPNAAELGAITSYGRSLLALNNNSELQTNIGIGTIAVQNANSVNITGGSITGITDLAVADGGTGASSASEARTNLGLGTLATQNGDFGNVSTSLGNVSSSIASVSTSTAANTTSLGNVSTSVASSATTLTNVSASTASLATSLGNVSTSLANQSTSNVSQSSSLANLTTSLGNVSTSVGNVSTSLGNASTSLANQSTSNAGQSTSIANITTSLGNVSTSLGNVSTSLVNKQENTRFDTVAALAAATVPASVKQIETAGYYAVGDGGGATAYYSATAPSHAGYYTSNSGTSFWIIDTSNGINLKAFGAKGDGVTDDTTAIQNCINYAQPLKAWIDVPAVQNAYLTTGLVIGVPGRNDTCHFRGLQYDASNAAQGPASAPYNGKFEAMCAIKLIAGSNRSLLTIRQDAAQPQFENITFDANGSAQTSGTSHAIYFTDVITSSTFTANAGTDELTLATTLTSDDWLTGTRIRVSNSGGALPAGLSAGTDYYVIKVSATVVKLATNRVNALAGTAINITDAGTGTQTVSLADYIWFGGYFKNCFIVSAKNSGLWIGNARGSGLIEKTWVKYCGGTGDAAVNLRSYDWQMIHLEIGSNESADYGMFMGFSTQIQMMGCVFYQNKTGLFVGSNVGTLQATNCVFDDHDQDGVYVADGSALQPFGARVFSNCVFKRNGKSANNTYSDIIVDGCDRTVLEAPQFVGKIANANGVQYSIKTIGSGALVRVSNPVYTDNAGNTFATAFTNDTSKVQFRAWGAIRSEGDGGSFATIEGSAASGAFLRLCRAGSASQNFYLSQFNGATFLKNLDSGDILFNTTTSDLTRMTIKSGGNIKIGTTGTQDAALHVARSGNVRFLVGDESQTTDKKNWDIISTGGTIYMRALSDNDSNSASFLTAERGGGGTNWVTSGVTLNTGGAERFRAKLNGQVRLVPLASDPAGAENGDMYYSSTLNKFRGYANGAWVDLH